MTSRSHSRLAARAWSPIPRKLQPGWSTNASPEPFSNVGLSLLEDVAVLGGLALIHFNPIWALAVFVLLLSIILYFAPRIFRAVRVKLWLIWKKLNGPAGSDVFSSLPSTLSSRYAAAFARENLLGETVAWAVPCIAKKVRGVPANSSGMLVANNEDASKVLFIQRSGWRARAQAINLEGCVAAREPKFLSENLLIGPADARGNTAVFLFERGQGERVEQIADAINRRLTTPVSPAPVPATAV